jgi:hypothetical protein
MSKTSTAKNAKNAYRMKQESTMKGKKETGCAHKRIKRLEDGLVFCLDCRAILILDSK